MKNIYILPTDKPSRIIKSQDNDFILLNTDAPNWFEINLKTTKQHIYITSDEEIKEGDWIFQECLNMPHRLIKTDAENVKVLNNLNKCKKIILTTDQDLIKDGVQAIPDDFLEWFVENPSCDNVEVMPIGFEDRDDYKIIIPKEEPKQCGICNMYPRLEGTNKCESCYSVIRHFLE